MRRYAFLIVALLVFAGMAGIVTVRILSGSDQDQGRMQRPAVPVAAYETARFEFADIVEALGTARSRESVIVSARVSDTISQINFDSGQEVEAGDILIELTDTEEAAGLSEARTTLREASRDLTRVNDLIARGVVPQQRQDEARAAVERAQARVASIEAQLADRIVRAPFSGVVGLREVSPGELIRPGDPITTLDDISAIRLDFTVPERFLATIRPGMVIEATTNAYPDQVFLGTIAQVDSRVDPISRAVIVRAEIDNPEGRLLPGQLMVVEVRRDVRSRPAVPGSAVTRYLEESFVYVLETQDGTTTAHRRDVELGLRTGNLVEITAGLEAGELIIAEGVHRVRDGMAVEITERRTYGPGSGLPDDTTMVTQP
ncbi:efflux RND transporter periplasmic adaptor subunit [Maricaulis sp.]|uniref:efflux RND transporter periplasmic adaptor subunit n=1 Tax=Maricaulis sp. TaxID=1486257 RepID=UPI003A8E5476